MVIVTPPKQYNYYDYTAYFKTFGENQKFVTIAQTTSIIQRKFCKIQRKFQEIGYFNPELKYVKYLRGVIGI